MKEQVKKFVLKNSNGQYFTMLASGMTTTGHYPNAFRYTQALAFTMMRAFNKKYNDDMAVIDADKEALTYYTKCLYHSFDEGDALRTTERVKKGKYAEYDDATPICVQGIWFVYAHVAEKEVAP